MAEIALPGITTELSYSDKKVGETTPTYTTLGTVIGLDSFGWEQTPIEATHLTSTAMHYESIPGPMRSLPISGTLHWNHNDATHKLTTSTSIMYKFDSAGAVTDAIRRKQVAWRLQLPFDDIDATPSTVKAIIEWNGHLTRFETNATLDDAIIANFEIDIVGPVTYVAEALV